MRSFSEIIRLARWLNSGNSGAIPVMGAAYGVVPSFRWQLAQARRAPTYGLAWLGVSWKMRLPSAAKSSVDPLAKAGDEAECGNSPLAIAVSRCAGTKAAAPVITRVKTASPATACQRRNVLNAAEVALNPTPSSLIGGNQKPHALQMALPGSGPHYFP